MIPLRKDVYLLHLLYQVKYEPCHSKCKCAFMCESHGTSAKIYNATVRYFFIEL
jgi:hypothetical protein